MGEWELARIDGSEIPCHGYWSGQWSVSGLLFLSRGDEGWMSLMPVEVESQQLAAECARGTTAVFGLGLRWLAAQCAMRADVDKVVVIERDRSLIEFHGDLALFERLPDGAGSKVGIVESDALEWQPAEPVDVLLIDIWQSLIGEGRLAEVERMQANVAAGAVHFWGQELEIARRAVRAGRRLDHDAIVATVGEIGLPLAGPERPAYAARVRGAAANWMGDQWLPGTPLPVDLGALS